MRRASVVLVLLALLLAGGRLSAQDATPGPDGTVDGTPIVLPSGLPVAPDPSECTVAAPTIDELLARLGVTPVPDAEEGATPDQGAAVEADATPAAFVLPAGEQADNTTVQRVVATMREVVACLNTGNVLTIFAFTSDAFLQQAQAEAPLTEEDVAFLRATPEAPAPEQYVALMAVREVTVLPDGRVGALVDTVFPDEAAAVQTDFIYFVEEDGRWLIDEIVEDLESRYPPAPVAPPAA